MGGWARRFEWKARASRSRLLCRVFESCQCAQLLPKYFYVNDKRVNWRANRRKKQRYIHDHFEKKALNFIKENQDRCFFLYLPFTLPHAKIETPDIRPRIKAYAGKWPKREMIFAEMVARLDGQCWSYREISRDIRPWRKKL